jgi:biotin carboxyl carrier protein
MKLKITIHGVAYEVDVQVLDAEDEMGGAPPRPAPAAAGAGAALAGPPAPAATPIVPPAEGAGVASPIAGTVLEVRCEVGDAVVRGQTLLVIEAMKMETAIAASGDGTIRRILVAAGDTVLENQTLVEFA